MYNDYDGVQHDYTRKQGLVWQQVFLPDMAPAEWADREILWNAVEEAEKTKDSRLAREFVVALPIELGKVFRHRELAQKIAGLTEDIEELKSEKALLLNQFNCVDDHGMTVVKQRIASMESSLKKLDQQEEKYTAELDAALAQYAELRQRAVDMDTAELEAARQTIRPDKERETGQRIQAAYRKDFDSRLLTQSRKEVADLLEEVAEPVSIREKLRRSVEQADKQCHTNRRAQER